MLRLGASHRAALGARARTGPLEREEHPSWGDTGAGRDLRTPSPPVGYPHRRGEDGTRGLHGTHDPHFPGMPCGRALERVLQRGGAAHQVGGAGALGGGGVALEACSRKRDQELAHLPWLLKYKK